MVSDVDAETSALTCRVWRVADLFCSGHSETWKLFACVSRESVLLAALPYGALISRSRVPRALSPSSTQLCVLLPYKQPKCLFFFRPFWWNLSLCINSIWIRLSEFQKSRSSPPSSQRGSNNGCGPVSRGGTPENISRTVAAWNWIAPKRNMKWKSWGEVSKSQTGGKSKVVLVCKLQFHCLNNFPVSLEKPENHQYFFAFRENIIKKLHQPVSYIFLDCTQVTGYVGTYLMVDFTSAFLPGCVFLANHQDKGTWLLIHLLALQVHSPEASVTCSKELGK